MDRVEEFGPVGLDLAREAAEHGSLEVPLHLRNAPTKLMKELGYGEEYRYAHDEPDAYAAGEDYFLGGSPLWEVCRVAYRVTKRPRVVGGLALLAAGVLLADVSGTTSLSAMAAQRAVIVASPFYGAIAAHTVAGATRCSACVPSRIVPSESLSA